jgi:aspartyl-tRNA(Asn)/glutamyl-tRNA(Gln) amidotransferase subunit C
LDTEDIPLTASVLPLSNVMREDAIGASLSQEDALANAPDVEDGFFRVPVVLEGEE